LYFSVGYTELLFRLMRAIVLRSELHPTEAEEAFARARVKSKIAGMKLASATPISL
jgi:hypothetical protein